MKYDSVIDLKREVLTEIDSRFFANYPENATVEGILAQRPERRIAIGYAQVSENNFHLELRVQRRDQAAFKYAETIVKQANGEANIEVIPRIEIPAREESKSQIPRTPIADPRTGQLQMGASIGTKDGGVGTLGAFLARQDGNYILSCNHVMVFGTGARISRPYEPGDSIFHPGREANFRLDATRQIAHLTNYIPLSRTEENDMDCAIAHLDSDWNYDVTRIPKGSGYPQEGKILKPMSDPDTGLQRDMRMCKIGRTTGFTRGLLRAVELDRVPVFLPAEGNVLFSNVIEIRSLVTDEPFSLPGDSGSLVYTEDGLEAIGLVFAGGMRDDGYKLSYVCKLNPILEWAQAELLS